MTDLTAEIPDRFARLERQQKRVIRGLIRLGIVVFLQTAVIAYLIIPFGGLIKHPITLQAGKFEVIDNSGTVRAELTAEYGQTLFKMSDAKGQTRVLLRENEAGFVTMEFTDRNFNDKAMTIFTGTKQSYFELYDPKSRMHLTLQAAEEGMGLLRFDERGQPLP